jgi:hypothetical protein
MPATVFDHVFIPYISLYSLRCNTQVRFSDLIFELTNQDAGISRIVRVLELNQI